MKMVVAIIKPFKLDEVREALSEIGVQGITVTEAKGFGRQKGQTEVYRGREISVNLLRKVQLQIAVNDVFVEPTINANVSALQKYQTVFIRSSIPNQPASELLNGTQIVINGLLRPLLPRLLQICKASLNLAG